MSTHEKLTAALLGVFEIDEANKPAAAGALAGVLVAFADAVRGPAPVVAELVAGELAIDPAQGELLNELRALVHEIRSDRLARAAAAIDRVG